MTFLRRSVASVAMVIGVSLTLAALGPSASADPYERPLTGFPGTFYMKPAHASSMCLTAHGGVRNGAAIDSYKCVNQNNQRWYISTLEDLMGLPVYRIQAAGSSELCAQLPNGADGARVRLAGCGSDKGVQFMISCAGNLRRCVIRGVDASTTKALSVRGGSTANNAPVILWPMNGAKDQEFNLQRA